ncbi:MAG: cytochrome c [Sulfurimonas sp.]|uniref:c-type cytochrome n=1 Tax=Sulfurimonas sp. TaxID=2022749 RepID=UPI0025ECE752|nr:c-type cytochrome [Sulfurimonas sp.]MCK9490917.1 cytochrome c [Sulfurimonas sp.]
MIKIISAISILSSLLLGVDGYEVYKKNCASCHIEIMKKAEMMKKFSTLKAPPMIQVALRLKENIIIRNEDEDVHRHLFMLFVKNYIENPSIDYIMCHPQAIDTFGVMKSIKGLSQEEKEAVAYWIYDRYEDVDFE